MTEAVSRWLLLFILGPVLPLHAGLADLSLDELMNVEVTLVSRRPQPLSETPAALTVLTGEELRQLGVRSLPDALRLVPGFQVGQVDANKWIVTSRGFAGLFANKLLVLVDGRSVYTPLFSGVFWESQGVLMEDIDRLEVIRGPGGTLWGANAVNGIVNVVTRPATETTTTFAEVGAGNQRRQISVRHGRQIPGGALRVDVERLDRLRTKGVAGRVVRDDWRLNRVGFRADVESTPSTRLLLSGNVRAGSVGQSVTFVAQPVPARAMTRYFDADLFSVDLLGRWTRRWSADHELEIQAYYDLFDREELVLKGRIHNADVDVQHRLRHGRHQWVWGAGYRRTWDDFDGTFTMWLEPASRTTHLFSAFIHDEIQLLASRLSLSGGTKLERNSYSGWEWQPSLRLRAAPQDDLSMWAGLSRAVRTPSRGDDDFRAAVGAVPPDSLFSGAPEAVVTLMGGDVAAENLLAFDTGIRSRLGRTTHLDVTGFLYSFDDVSTQEPGLPFIETERGPSHLVLPVRNASLAKATSYGIEVGLDWGFKRDWQIRASYTWFRLNTKLDDISRADPINFYENDSPRHQLAARSLMSHHDWSVGVSARWVARLPGPQPDIPSYLAADVKIARSLTPTVEVAVTGTGLIGDHREAVANTVGAVPTRVRREIFVSMSWGR